MGIKRRLNGILHVYRIQDCIVYVNSDIWYTTYIVYYVSYSIGMLIDSIGDITNLNMKTAKRLAKHRHNQSTEMVGICRNVSRIWAKTTTRKANETFS